MMPYHGDLKQLILSHMEPGKQYTTPELREMIWPNTPAYECQVTNTNLNRCLRMIQKAGKVDKTKVPYPKGGYICVWWLT